MAMERFIRLLTDLLGLPRRWLSSWLRWDSKPTFDNTMDSLSRTALQRQIEEQNLALRWQMEKLKMEMEAAKFTATVDPAPVELPIDDLVPIIRAEVAKGNTFTITVPRNIREFNNFSLSWGDHRYVTTDFSTAAMKLAAAGAKIHHADAQIRGHSW